MVQTNVEEPTEERDHTFWAINLASAISHPVMSSFLIAQILLSLIFITIELLGYRRVLVILSLTFAESVFSLLPVEECWRNINRGGADECEGF